MRSSPPELGLIVLGLAATGPQEVSTFAGNNYDGQLGIVYVCVYMYTYIHLAGIAVAALLVASVVLDNTSEH